MPYSVLDHHGDNPQLRSQPDALWEEPPRKITLHAPLFRRSGERSHSTGQTSCRLSRDSGTGWEAVVEGASQNKQSAARSSTCSSPYLPRLSSPRASVRLSPSSVLSSRSVSPIRSYRTPSEAASRGQGQLCLQPTPVSRVDVTSPGSTNQAGGLQSRSEMLPIITVRRLPRLIFSLSAEQRSPPRRRSRSCSQPHLPEGWEDFWQGALPGASPALIQLAKDLLGVHACARKASVIDRESRRTHRSHNEGAGAADEFEADDVARDHAEESCTRRRRMSERVFDNVEPLKACVPVDPALPDAVRRFFRAALLFLRDCRPEFSFWAELRRAHHQLAQMFSSECGADTTCTMAEPLVEKRLGRTLSRKALSEMQHASNTHSRVPPPSGNHRLETKPPSSRTQANTTECIPASTGEYETSPATNMLRHQLITDAEARKLAQLDEICDEHTAPASSSASRSSEDTAEIPMKRFPRARSFHPEILWDSEEDGSEAYYEEKSSGDGGWTTDLQNSDIEVDEEIVSFSDADKSSDQHGLRLRASSTGTGAEHGGERRCTVSYVKLSPKPDLDPAKQFDAVVAQLKAAARASKTSLHVLRSELIGMQAITEGSLQSTILQVLTSRCPPNPPTVVLPLVASAYVLILASLLDARKQCCHLLVACCRFLSGLLELQRDKVEQIAEAAPHWRTTAAHLTRQMDLVSTSTLRFTSSFVADAEAAFLNVLTIVYPFASVVRFHRLRRRKARERAHERKLVLRGMELESLVMKCEDSLADLQIREGKLRQRLGAAMRSQQEAASRADTLSSSIYSLRKQETKLQNSARALVRRHPGNAHELQSRLEQVGKQRQMQQKELSTVDSKMRKARDLVEAIQVEQRQSTEARRLLERERAAFLHERKCMQRMFAESSDHWANQRIDLRGGFAGPVEPYAAADACYLASQDKRLQQEGLLRCIAELTQLVLQALKFDPGTDADCIPGPARHPESALLSKAYKEYMVRVVNENDFRHALLSCTTSVGAETETEGMDESESDSSFQNDDRSSSLRRNSGGSFFKGPELAIPVVSSSSLDSAGIDNIKSRPGEFFRESDEIRRRSVCCESEAIHSFANAPPLRTDSPERSFIRKVPSHTIAGGCEEPNVEPKEIFRFLQEPLLVARVTALQCLNCFNIATLDLVKLPTWRKRAARRWKLETGSKWRVLGVPEETV